MLVKRDEILAALKRCKAIIRPSKSYPILSNVRMETKNGSIELAATNLDTTIRTSIAMAEYDSCQYSVCVDAGTMISILGDIPEDIISLEPKETKIKISASGFSANVYVVDPSNYVGLPYIEGGDYRVEADVLRYAFSRVMFASGKQTKSAAEGAFLDISGGTIRVCATNGHMISSIEVNGDPNSNFEMSEPISQQFHSELSGFIMNGVNIGCNDNHVSLTCVNGEMATKRYTVPRPNINRVIEKAKSDCSQFAIVNRQELISGLKMVSSLADNSIASLVIGDDKTAMMATGGPLGNANAEIETIETSGADTEAASMRLNCDYVLAMLKSVDSAAVKVSFGHSGAVIISPVEDDPMVVDYDFLIGKVRDEYKKVN